LDTFLRPKLVRNIVSQKSNKLDIAVIMNEGKVLLVKLAQGAIGEENAALLGTLFVAKLHQITLGRQELKHENRRPFYLYLDEFANFITPSMRPFSPEHASTALAWSWLTRKLRQLLKDSDVSAPCCPMPPRACAFVSGGGCSETGGWPLRIRCRRLVEPGNWTGYLPNRTATTGLQSTNLSRSVRTP